MTALQKARRSLHSRFRVQPRAPQAAC